MIKQKENIGFHKKTTFQINFIKFLFYIFLLIVGVLAVYALIPFITAFIIAFIISYLFEPLLIFFERKHIPRLIIILLIIIAIIIFFIVIIILIKKYLPNQEELSNFERTITINMINLKEYLSHQINFINWNEIFSNIQVQVDSELKKRMLL